MKDKTPSTPAEALAAYEVAIRQNLTVGKLYQDPGDEKGMELISEHSRRVRTAAQIAHDLKVPFQIRQDVYTKAKEEIVQVFRKWRPSGR